jgi:hypothetical protein
MFFASAKVNSKQTGLSVFLVLMTYRLLAAPTGPTLELAYGSSNAPANAISEFMYFVPLISPEPVSVFTNAGNTQCARILSFHCETNGVSFRAVCEFEFTGQGSQQNKFDHTSLIQQREQSLKAGTAITHHLDAINVEGPGSGSVEIKGTLEGGQRVVNEVRMRFNQHRQTSPVTIDLSDICYRDGKVQSENKIVARVNSLLFERKPGTPKMEVTLASIKKKDASNSLWQNFIGGIKGVTANLFLPPLTIEAEGHQAMLDFGQALATEKSKFTFPHAVRLKGALSPGN